MTTGKKAQKNTRAYERSHPEARKMDLKRGKIEADLKAGRIKKPASCPKCGRKPPDVRIEYDHHSKGGGWSCSKCNKRGGAVTKAKRGSKK